MSFPSLSVNRSSTTWSRHVDDSRRRRYPLRKYYIKFSTSIGLQNSLFGKELLVVLVILDDDSNTF